MIRLPNKLPRMRKNFSKSELLGFYKQFFGLLRAGLPIIHCLEILNYQKRGQLNPAINGIKAELQSGKTLSQAFGSCGFPASDVNLIRIGEENANLQAAFTQIVAHLERWLMARKKIKKALTYPVIVLSLSLISLANARTVE